MQSGVGVGANDISGTLNYVTGYTGFSGDPAEQSGHYLALHADTAVEGSTIVVELSDSGKAPVTLDSDRTIVLRIENKSQTIKITASKEGYDTVTKTYTLSGLTLAPEE